MANKTLADALQATERSTGRRIGVYALDTHSGAALSYRAGERFPMCSTYKPLCVAAVLHQNNNAALQQRISYGRADLVEYSPVTAQHVENGMTVEQLCMAAIRYSDNTAANLLLAHAGGPAGVTAFLRRARDPITRLDREEPLLNAATPGDLRDTTTPQAIASDYLHLATSNVLDSHQRALLVDWLRTNTTGDEEIRLRVPGSWTVGDKTGSGAYGVTNDVAILWPHQKSPIALAILTTAHQRNTNPDPAVIAHVTRSVVSALQL